MVQLTETTGRRTKAVRNPAMLWLVCGATLVLAGCGGSSHKVSTTQIRGRVLVSNELAGFKSAGVIVYPTVQEWLSNPNDQQSPAQAAAEKAMLTRQGFKTGAVENLTGPAPAAGLSTVEQFRSPTAARVACAFYISQLKSPAVAPGVGAFAAFKVQGIPGAVGYTLGGASGGANISFVQGDYCYLVGREGASRSDIAGLSAAARHLYQRARG